MDWTINFLGDVSKMLEGCEDVQMKSYFQANFDKPELKGMLCEWQGSTMSTVMLGVWLRRETSESEAGDFARAYT